MINRLNYPGDVRAEFQIGSYLVSLTGETATDTAGYPLVVRGMHYDGEVTTLEVEVAGRPVRGEK